MHVLFLPSWYPETDGDFRGSFFKEQAEAIAESGHTVGVLAVEPLSVTDPRALSALRLRIARRTEGGAFGPVTVFRALGLRPLPRMHNLNVRALARRWNQLFQQYVLENGTPDVLHAHAMNPAGIAAAYIARKHGIPFVVTEHRPDSAIAELSLKSLGRLLREVANQAKARIAVSPAFAEALTHAYGGAKWDMIPNLLPQQLERNVVTQSRHGAFIFGHVSNLHPYKRVGLLLDAFLDAFGNDPGVVLRIAGDSPYLSEHRQHAQRIGLTQVEFVGAVARADIAAEFARYDAFVMPSAAESFGVVFWEALACGVPIIATATDGGRYAVREDTGLLVDVDDQAGLTNALMSMRAEAEGFDRSHLRAVSVKECGQEEFVRRYTAVYASAVREEL